MTKKRGTEEIEIKLNFNDPKRRLGEARMGVESENRSAVCRLILDCYFASDFYSFHEFERKIHLFIC